MFGVRQAGLLEDRTMLGVGQEAILVVRAGHGVGSEAILEDRARVEFVMRPYWRPAPGSGLPKRLFLRPRRCGVPKDPIIDGLTACATGSMGDTLNRELR
jgi:hypothetical protein